ncbi:uncharacterized protein LOC120092775 isoform X1 [Benincasa hispida]|uniref:uncharacterized protein LOC120092775 isoform X1 n=1 Tax=Benincasa hispida TaxID=102211 RepID=UPI0019015613|nr:uncharacterized protein LOC120092775 isoform X1 [Benincasa hispida]
MVRPKAYVHCANWEVQAIQSTVKIWCLQHLTERGNSRRSKHLTNLFNGTILVSISAALSEAIPNDEALVVTTLNKKRSTTVQLPVTMFFFLISSLSVNRTREGPSICQACLMEQFWLAYQLHILLLPLPLSLLFDPNGN